MILFYILVFVMAMPNHPFFELPFAGLTIIKYLGIACFGYAVIRSATRGSLPNFLSAWQVRAFFLLLILCALSLLFSGQSIGLEFSPGITYLSFLFFVLTTIAVIDSRSRLQMSLMAAVGSIGIASLYVLREFQKSGGTELRPGWIAGDSNYFTINALLILPLAYYTTKNHRPFWERWFCVGCLLVILPAITLASSRGGFLGLCAAAGYMILRSKQWKRDLLLGFIFLVPLMLFAPSSPIKRFFDAGYAEQIGVETRQTYWRSGLNMVREHPLTGVGLGKFKQMVDRYGDRNLDLHGIAHNTYLEITAELGVFGLLAFLAVLGFSWAALEKVRARAALSKDKFMFYNAVGIQAGLLGYTVAAFFL